MKECFSMMLNIEIIGMGDLNEDDLLLDEEKIA